MFSSRRMARLIAAALIGAFASGGVAAAQDTTPPAGRAAAIEEAQAKKATALHPLIPGKVEEVLNRVEDVLVSGRLHVHPFFESAYAGGGFTLGAGYMTHVSPYNMVDVRGSITLSGYKRIEAAFTAPRLFDRRGALALLGGWREATDVGFYGTGTANTSKDGRASYSFDQPYGSATLDLWPVRKLLLFQGGVEVSKWSQGPGPGGESGPTVDDVYTPETLPGLGSSPTYLHTQGTVALDSRPSPGYARRGSYLAATAHDFRDQDSLFGFRKIDYEAIQHVPILREAWVLSLRARIEMASAADGQAVPFYMLPALGGGSSLRGFSSWRFRDLNALLLQAEWRVIGSRYIDMALFYDAGRVADRRGDLFAHPMKDDFGIGLRLHSGVATPLRIEFAKSNEGFAIVFSSKASF